MRLLCKCIHFLFHRIYGLVVVKNCVTFEIPDEVTELAVSLSPPSDTMPPGIGTVTMVGLFPTATFQINVPPLESANANVTRLFGGTTDESNPTTILSPETNAGIDGSLTSAICDSTCGWPGGGLTGGTV